MVCRIGRRRLSLELSEEEEESTEEEFTEEDEEHTEDEDDFWEVNPQGVDG